MEYLFSTGVLKRRKITVNELGLSLSENNMRVIKTGSTDIYGTGVVTDSKRTRTGTRAHSNKRLYEYYQYPSCTSGVGECIILWQNAIRVSTENENSLTPFNYSGLDLFYLNNNTFCAYFVNIVPIGFALSHMNYHY